MDLKECTNWSEIDYLEAECPHCHIIDVHCGIAPRPGMEILCKAENNKKCEKWFKLGERE